MTDYSDGIYSPGPIRPVVKIQETLGVLTQRRWEYFRAIFIEGMPRSTPLVADLVALSGATSIVANGTIARRVLAILQLNTNELLHLRWEPIDNVEGVLWEQAGAGRWAARGATARVDQGTKVYDPYLATTTFFILGRDRDMNLEVRNPMGVALPQARFSFWGYRYVLEPIAIPKDDKDTKALADGEPDIVRRRIGPVTFVPAEGLTR